MKKISLYGLTALSFIVLAACSAKSTEETSSSSSSEVTSSVSTAKKSKSAGTSQEDVINELKSIFDPNGNSKDFDIKVEKDAKSRFYQWKTASHRRRQTNPARFPSDYC